MKTNKGFTLIEIAIVLAIVGILFGVVMLRGESIIGNAKTTDTIALIKDLSTAVSEFKNRYHYLPGDLPQASENIQNITTGCNISTTTTAIGNGQIDTSTEIGCVAEHLVDAGLIKGAANGIFSKNNSSSTPDVFVTAKRTTGTNPPSFPSMELNEIQLINQPCETAITLDEKLDDGNFSAGKIQASVTTCVVGGTNDPVPFIDIAI